jgi:hypothetical protein
MENSKGIPVPLNEKQSKLMSAIADELTKISINITPGTIMYFAGALAERVVKEGWQWHPVATEINLDYNRVALKEYPDPTPEQEIEIIDRVISGLPMLPVDNTPFIVEEYMEEMGEKIEMEMVESDVKFMGKSDLHLMDEVYMANGVKLVDVNSLYPYVINEWVRVPEFDNYEINITLGLVRSRWTKRVLDIAEQGGESYVDMHDKEGHSHDVNIRYIIEQVKNS